MQKDLTEEKKKIKSILNYSYIRLNPSNYSRQFLNERKLEIDKFKINFDQIEEDINSYKFDRIIDCFQTKFLSLETNKPDDISTKNILSGILQKIVVNKNISEIDMTALSLFQKKFEISHKIYRKYDNLMKKSDDYSKDIQIYSLLATIFFLLFVKTKDFNLLNSAIKLNDLILKSGWSILEFEKQMVYLSLILEKIILEKLL